MIIFFFDIGFVALLIFLAIAVAIYGSLHVVAWFVHHMTTILIIVGVIMAVKSVLAVLGLHNSDRKFCLSDLAAIPLDFVRGTIVLWFILNMFIAIPRTFLIGIFNVIPLGFVMAWAVYLPLFAISFKSTFFAELVSIGILLLFVIGLCHWPGNDFFYIGNEIFRYLSVMPECIGFI